MWRVGIPLASLLFFLVLMVLIPMSANAYGGASRLAIAGPVQATPTVDLTVTALAKEQLKLQVQQLQNQLQDQNNWFANNSTALIAAAATVIVALFGIFQWAITVRQTQDKDLKDREEERRKEIAAQDKELRDRAEERFKAAITALGSENEATQVGGAILLRSFLNKADEAIYGRYYTQIFDLAVSYLRLPRMSEPPLDPDGLPATPEDPNVAVPLTPLRQALVDVFKEVFPFACEILKKQSGRFVPQSLDASRIRLDGMSLERAELNDIYMRGATLTDAHLDKAYLTGALLMKANFTGADLWGIHLDGAALHNAIFTKATLITAELMNADFTDADFTDADLCGADLSGAKLSGTKLRGAKYNTKAIRMKVENERPVIDPQGTIWVDRLTKWPQGFNPDGAVDVAAVAFKPS